MSVTFEQIEAAEQALGALRDTLLRERGWEYTSATPSPCYWLWIKVIDGKRYTLPTALALSIERAVDQAKYMEQG